MSLWIIFLTGLSTGGLTCLALQGGLLATALVESDEIEHNKSNKIKTIILFLSSKLVAYSILGFLLGFLGNFFQFSPKFSGWLNLLISLFMFGVAMETLKVHPIFRYFLIQTPKSLRRLVKKTSQNKSNFTAIILGLSTVLIPCGTTQAMMALAVSSEKPLTGLLILSVFIMGTIPLFFILGYFATSIGSRYEHIFKKVIAGLLIVLSIYTFINGLKILGLNLKPTSNKQTSSAEIIADQNKQIQKVSIKVSDSGYDPSTIKVKKGIPVEVELVDDNIRGCARVFVVPKLNIRKVIYFGKENSFTFNPEKVGKINFTCSMGMYYGEFIVEE